jgi:hypothetical protein
MIASYGGIWFSEGRDRDQASMFDAEPLLPMPEVELADLVMPRSGSVLSSRSISTGCPFFRSFSARVAAALFKT